MGDSVTESADRVAGEIVRLLEGATVRDRKTGTRRRARPADIAILFRSRDAHREFEKALERRAVATYVFKGLGFFDADEVQDAVALLRYLADPYSELRTAAFLRSRLVRLSDAAIATLARNLSDAVRSVDPPAAVGSWSGEDRAVFAAVRRAVAGVVVLGRSAHALPTSFAACSPKLPTSWKSRGHVAGRRGRI